MLFDVGCCNVAPVAGSHLNNIRGSMGKHSFADVQPIVTCRVIHGEADRNIFISGISTIDIQQPAHHREVTFLGEVMMMSTQLLGMSNAWV